MPGLDDDTVEAWNQRMAAAGLKPPQANSVPPAQAPVYDPSAAYGSLAMPVGEKPEAAPPAANGPLPASLPSPEDFSNLIDAGHKEHAKKAYEDLSRRYGAVAPDQSAPLQATGGRPVMAQGPQATRQPGMIPMGMPGGVPGKPPAAIGEMNAALQGQKTAAVNEARAEAEANDAAAQSNIGAQGYLRGESDQAQEAEDTRRHAMGEQQAEYDMMRRDAATAGKNLDYDRWMKSGGAGKRVAVVLAQALGAAGAALTHTENYAAKIIQSEIDRDVEQQKDQLASKQASVREKAADLQRMRERFGDERSGEAALRAQRWEAYKLGAQAEAQQAQSPVLEARAQQVAGVADQKIAEFHMQIASHGAGADPRTKIIEDQKRIYESSKGAMTPHDAQRASFMLNGLPDPFPNEPPLPGWGPTAKNASAAQAIEGALNQPAPGSLNWREHPLDAATAYLGIHGTQGVQKQRAIEANNAQFATALAEREPRMARAITSMRPGEKPPSIVQPFVHVAGETEEEGKQVDRARATFFARLGPGGAAPAPTEPEAP